MMAHGGESCEVAKNGSLPILEIEVEKLKLPTRVCGIPRNGFLLMSMQEPAGWSSCFSSREELFFVSLSFNRISISEQYKQ